MAQTFAMNSHELGEIGVPVEPSQIAPNGTTQEELQQEQDGHSLPPADGGRAAWTLLLAGFVFEALLWGS